MLLDSGDKSRTTKTEGEYSVKQYMFDFAEMDRLLKWIRQLGYTLFGPQVKNKVIVYDEILSVDDMPKGFVDEQSGGEYFLRKNDNRSLFSFSVGPDSWKKFLFPQQETIFKAELTPDGLRFISPATDSTKRAFIGIRSCEIEALKILDKVYLEGEYRDEQYAERRKNTLIVAVNCTRAADTCFCASMEHGPSVTAAYDLALTEVINEDEHYFCVHAGSSIGDSIITDLQFSHASEAHEAAAKAAMDNAYKQSRHLDSTHLKELLYKNLENKPFWDQLGERCLSCGSCTMVCPTCFCSDVNDATELSGKSSERVRQWDSCFNASHSYLVGGSVRKSNSSRYRQWLTHKLASWQDQFETLGCVGCGRCITWCPVGIDLTEELIRLRDIEEGIQ